jgi:hypothetical protein
MNIGVINDITDLTIKIGSVIFGGIVSAWGVNKLWLSSIYVSKKEMSKAIQDSIEPFIKTKDEMHSFKQDFEVFKVKYEGDRNLQREQYASQKEITKEILHKVNNISNLNIPQMMKLMIEEHENAKSK